MLLPLYGQAEQKLIINNNCDETLNLDADNISYEDKTDGDTKIDT